MVYILKHIYVVRKSREKRNVSNKKGWKKIRNISGHNTKNAARFPEVKAIISNCALYQEMW